MKHTVPHDLDLQTARRVADRAWSSYQERFSKYEPTLRWMTDHRAEVGFSATGIHLKGTLELSPGRIEMDLDVPFLLRVFKAKAIAIVDQEIRKWIAVAKAGDL